MSGDRKNHVNVDCHSCDKRQKSGWLSNLNKNVVFDVDISKIVGIKYKSKSLAQKKSTFFVHSHFLPLKDTQKCGQILKQ